MALRQAPGAGATVPRWGREALGAAAAIAIGIAVVTAVAASARSALLFSDGDSLVTTLVVRSIAAEQSQEWAMSSVLFLPETVVLGLLTLLGLGVNATLAVAGVVNVVALYGALRVAAGAFRRTRAPIAGALLGVAGFALLAVSETSPDRDALELASLLVTTTYYSATVVGVVLAVGLARRALDAGRSRRGEPSVGAQPAEFPDAAAPDSAVPDSAVPRGLLALLGVVAAASVVTNPLFAAWATIPLGLVLAVVWQTTRKRIALWTVAALVAGTVLGFVARVPLAPLIANTGAGYAHPSRWPESAAYYGMLLAERWSAPWGAASLLALLMLWGWCVAATLLLARRGDLPAAVVAACGWAMPLLVVIGAIALGTNAARYLQPAAFAPMLGLVVLPAVLSRWADAGARVLAVGSGRGEPVTAARGRGIAAVGDAAVILLAAGGLGIPRIAAAATAPDADLDCVVAWTEQSGRIGAGQFWTVRLPKTHLADPRGLVQVDHELNGYAWLVNRDDFAVGEVSFLVLDDQSPPFSLPDGTRLADAELIPCGRYTIADFGTRGLSLGPQRS